MPILAAGVALAFGTALLHWPGELNADSQEQLDQAILGRFNDWHPPIMAWLWYLLGPRPETMLLLQVVPYWSGFALLSLSVPYERRAWRWIVLALGLTPIGIHQIGVLQKDSLLAAMLVLAAGILAYTGKRRYALVPALLGSLGRINGIFALAAFLGVRRRLWSTLLLVGVIAAVLLPLFQFVNHEVLRAERTGVQRSLQWFDLAGIAARSGDLSVLPQGTQIAGRCYTPLFWDSLRAPECGGPLARLPESLTGQWLKAIVSHPLAYAEHRLAYFNSTTFFLVPPMHQCVEAPQLHQCDFSTKGLIKDAIEKNFLLWPILWLVVGALLLRESLGNAERIILVSGLAYGMAYLVVGVAAQFRYFLWTELAVQIVIALHLARGATLKLQPYLVAAGLVAALGYGARYLVLA